MQSLRFSIEVYGLASIELVPSYLILGEASIGLGRLAQAEEYLSQAQWTVLKTPSCSDAIRSKLYRNLGLLYAAKGEYEEALRQLADDIYHASEQYGTEDIHTSGGYFHMANVFFRQNRMEIANSLYSQVTHIWFEHLLNLVEKRISAPPPSNGVALLAESGGQDDGLDEAQEAEAIQVLNAIYDMREQQKDIEAVEVANIAYSLAMLHYILDDVNKAKEFGRKALVAAEDMPNEEFSRNIVDFLKVCEQVI